MRILNLAATFLLALTASLSAQAPRKWIIDRFNRPGADFTDIHVALQAASPGDRLLIRASHVPYTSVLYVSKGVTIEPEWGVRFGWYGSHKLVVHHLPAGQRFAWIPPPYVPYAVTELQVNRCNGSILLESLKLRPVEVQGARRMELRGCVLVGDSPGGTDLLFSDSSVILQDCTNSLPQAYVPTLVLERSTLHSVRSTLNGPRHTGGTWDTRDRHALHVGERSRAFLRAGSISTGGSIAPLLTGRGIYFVDPSVTLRGILPAEVRVRQTDLLSMLDEDRQADGMRRLSLHGPSGSACALFFGQALVRPLRLPGVGDLWLDPNDTQWLSVRTLDAGGQATVDLPLGTFFPPNHALDWQAISLSGADAPLLSQPLVTRVR